MLRACLVAIIVLASAPGARGGPVSEGECSGLPGRIYEQEQEELAKVAPDAGMMLELIRQAEACVDADQLDNEGERLTQWLLNNRVFWLVEANQYDKADQSVERFFAVFTEGADSVYLAKFHAWRIKLAALRGRVFEGMAAYAEAIPYRKSLSEVERARLGLDGAYLYLRLGQVAFAQEKAEAEEHVLTVLVETADSLGVQEAGVDVIHAELARAWHLQGEAALAQGNTGRARALFWRSASVQDAEDKAEILAQIGNTYAAEGDSDTAHHYYEEALVLARKQNDHPGEVLALYSLGVQQARTGRLALAEASLLAARQAGEKYRIGAFEADALIALGDVHERSGRTGAALAAYRRAVSAAREGSRFGDASERLALEQAQEAALRLASLEPGGGGTARGAAVVLLIVLLAGAATGLWRRKTGVARSIVSTPTLVREAGLEHDYVDRALGKSGLGKSPEAIEAGDPRLWQAYLQRQGDLPEPNDGEIAGLAKAFAETCDRYAQACLDRQATPRGVEGWEGFVFERALELHFGKEIWAWLLARQFERGGWDGESDGPVRSS